MRIAGKNKWKILLKYYPPWDGRRPRRVKKRDIREIREVFEMVADPRELRGIPEDVRAILKFVRLEAILQDA